MKKVFSINSRKLADRAKYNVPAGTKNKNFTVAFSLGATELTVYGKGHDGLFDTVDEAKDYATDTLRLYGEKGHSFNSATILETESRKVHAEIQMRNYGSLEITTKFTA